MEVSLKMMIGDGWKRRGVLLQFFVFEILLGCFCFDCRSNSNFTSEIRILGVGLKKASLMILYMSNFLMILIMRLGVVVDGDGVVIR